MHGPALAVHFLEEGEGRRKFSRLYNSLMLFLQMVLLTL